MQKPKFDPNKAFEVVEQSPSAKPKFNPDAPFKVADAVSKKESISRGAAQGATLGFADEISGVTEALWEKAKGDPAEFGQLYAKFRDESRSNFEKAKKANPGSYLTGEFGAGIATAFVPGVGVAKGAKLLSTAGKAALTGAAAGTGYSEADDATGVAIDAAAGGALGFGAAKAAPYIGKAISKGGKSAKSLAERMAARAIGAERGTVNKIGQEKIQQAGRYALDEGIISPLASTDDMIARNEAAKRSAMNARDAAYQKIDDAGASTFNPLNVATKVEEKVIGNSNRAHLDTQDLIKKLTPEIDNILSRGDGNISMKEAQALVTNLGKKAKFDSSRSTEANEMAKNVYHVVRSAINEAAEKSSDSINLGSVVKEANRRFSTGKDAQALLTNKQAREQGNKLIGLTDWALLGGSAPAALLSGGSSIPATIGALAVKKGAERYGAQNAALALDKIGNVMSRAPKAAEGIARAPVLLEQTAVSPIRPRVSESLRQVAENDRPTKGPEKWANDGIDLIEKAQPGIDRAVLESLKNTPSGKRLLIEASTAKNPKAMEKVLEKIRTASAQGGQ